jgi:anti-sigma factor RsiW
MNAADNEAGEPQSEIEELLPWHAAGTLSRRDAARVEEALARDPELARRYELVREELEGTIHLNESLGAPSARASEALFAKIAAEPRRTALPPLNLAARLSGFIAGFSPRTLAYAAAAAVLAIVVQAGVIGGVLVHKHDGTSGGFRTASAPATQAPVETGSYAMIRFAPQASAADITRFLETNKLTIAGGPMPGGMFRVRVAVTGLPKDDLARLVKQLQSDKVVDFIATIE